MKHMHLEYPVYDFLFVPNGSFVRDNGFRDRCINGAFHFARLAQRVLYQLPREIVYEGDTDPMANLRTLADSVALLYGIKDLNELMKFVEHMRDPIQAKHWYWDPRLDAWLATAGASYNEVSREEKTTNISD